MSDAEKPKFFSTLLASIQKEEPPPPSSSSAASRKPPQKKTSHDDSARQLHSRKTHGHANESGHHKSKSKKNFVYAPVKKASTTTDVPSESSPLESEVIPTPPTPLGQRPQSTPPEAPATKKPFDSSLQASLQNSNARTQSKLSSSSSLPRQDGFTSTPSSASPVDVSRGEESRPIGFKSSLQSSLQVSLQSVKDTSDEVVAAPKKTLRQSIEERGQNAPTDRAYIRSASYSSRDDKPRVYGGRRQESDFRPTGDVSRDRLSRHTSFDRGANPPHLTRQASSEKRGLHRSFPHTFKSLRFVEPPSILSRLGPPTDSDSDVLSRRQTASLSIHSRVGPSVESTKRDESLPRSLGTRHSTDDGSRTCGKDRANSTFGKPPSSRSPVLEKPSVKGGSSLLQPSVTQPLRATPPSLQFSKPSVKGSSLVEDISTMDSLRQQLTSSMALSLARSNARAHAREALVKTRYTAAQLRALNTAPNAPRPADLVDLTAISVVPASPRKSSKMTSRFSTSKATSSVVRIRSAQSAKAASSQRGGKGGRGGQKGKSLRHQPPPPPLSDEPVVPYVKSETRWVPSKEKEKPKDIQHQVKTLLNKLTRDQFEKITADLSAIPLKSLDMLSTVIAMIMDKALDEPNFAEVYADLCARLHQHIVAHPLPFLHAAYHVSDQVWYWTAANRSTFPVFHGPVSSRDECLAAAASFDSNADGVPAEQVQAPSFFVDKDRLVVVATRPGNPKGLYYAAVNVNDLKENEPLLGGFATEELAMKNAVKLTSFKRLLITRCQHKFDNSDAKPKPSDDADDHAAARAARRMKTLMLGNMRFLGELFKVELIAESVVQECIFKLLGLKLVQVEGGAQAAQTVRMPDEEDLEALCKMLATVGKKFDHMGNKTAMTMIVVRMVELSDTPSLPSRIRFLLKDVLEMRDYQWVPRRKELQQKTLVEVRREAEKLQKLGKNAQHDDLQGKRHRAAHSSLDLAKENSMLLLRQIPAVSSIPGKAAVVDPTNRIKSILQEYQSLRDIDETRQCVAELPRENHLQVVEQALSVAVEGKEKEREAAVDMLVGLYETLHLGATEIQSGVLSTLEFLDDLRIDIPMVHEYCGYILGRLIVAGCFGLSWLQLGVAHLAESGLAGKVLVEVLSVMDDELGFDSVVAMLAREELNVAGFLPPDQQSPDDVTAFLKLYDLTSYFYDDDDEEDEEVKEALHSMVQEFFVVQDLNEVDACLQDLDAHPWAVSLVKAVLNILCECKQVQRPLVLALLRHVLPNVPQTDLDAGLAWWLNQLDDVVIDVPQAAVYVAPVLALALHERALTWPWLASAVENVQESTKVQLVEGICNTLDSWNDRDHTRQVIQESGVSLCTFATRGGDRLLPWFA